MKRSLEAVVGRVRLPNPVMAASGCFGTGAELLGTVDASRLGAVVTKSMSAAPWEGNPPPRLHPVGGGMLNSVGLQNPGVQRWLTDGLPRLLETGVRVVASIWGHTVADFEKVAVAVAGVADGLVAVEVNLSCPNLSSPAPSHPDGAAGGHIFAHDPVATSAVVAAVVAAVDPLPVWAKLSPNVTSPVPAARAAREGGADAVVLTNTLIAMAIDPVTLEPVLANGTGGLSGPALRPVAVRMVHETAAAVPGLAIVGVGGISTAEHAVEHLAAGASAVQVGAAHLADPGAGCHIVRKLPAALRRCGRASVADLVGAAHRGPA